MRIQDYIIPDPPESILEDIEQRQRVIELLRQLGPELAHINPDAAEAAFRSQLRMEEAQDEDTRSLQREITTTSNEEPEETNEN